MSRYPFGQPVTAREPVRNSGGLFLLGAYPSALHVRWRGPDGTSIAAMAVYDEPIPFWTGDDQDERIDAWKRRVGFGAEWGSVEAAMQNGTSGRWVDEQILGPLGFERKRAWITDCLDTYRVSTAQAKAIAQRFVPFADRLGLSHPDLPPHPSEDAIVKEALADHRHRLTDELRAAEPTTIVTLGNAALRVMQPLVDDADGLEPRLYAQPYGRRLRVTFDGHKLAWYPLVHPGGRGPVKTAHDDWTRLRSDPAVVASRGLCPACGGRGLVPIMYGMPTGDVLPDVDAGRIAIGGCVITGDDPEWHCIECGSSVYADGRFDVEEW